MTKKTCLLLGNSFKVLGLSSTSFGDDPFISVFPIQFCLLTEIMSHIHLFRACLVSLLKQICVQIDFQRFRQIQESNSWYQSVSRQVVHSMHCTPHYMSMLHHGSKDKYFIQGDLCVTSNKGSGTERRLLY